MPPTTLCIPPGVVPSCRVSGVEKMSSYISKNDCLQSFQELSLCNWQREQSACCVAVVQN